MVAAVWRQQYVREEKRSSLGRITESLASRTVVNFGQSLPLQNHGPWCFEASLVVGVDAQQVPASATTTSSTSRSAADFAISLSYLI